MAIRVIRRDSKGLFVFDNNGYKCRPTGPTYLWEGERRDCKFSSSSFSGLVLVPVQADVCLSNRTEMWSQE